MPPLDIAQGDCSTGIYTATLTYADGVWSGPLETSVSQNPATIYGTMYLRCRADGLFYIDFSSEVMYPNGFFENYPLTRVGDLLVYDAISVPLEGCGTDTVIAEITYPCIESSSSSSVSSSSVSSSTVDCGPCAEPAEGLSLNVVFGGACGCANVVIDYSVAASEFQSVAPFACGFDPDNTATLRCAYDPLTGRTWTFRLSSPVEGVFTCTMTESGACAWAGTLVTGLFCGDITVAIDVSDTVLCNNQTCTIAPAPL